VREARRVLKEDGVLVVSVPDRLTDAGDGQGRMHVPEFREMLGRHFGHVHLYRQGAVAGGFVFPASGGVTSAPVESAGFYSAEPRPGAEPPATRSVLAVCGDEAGALGEMRPYLLVDRDRRALDEREERAEDVELLREEIGRMQETEVQAFVETIRVQRGLVALLPQTLPHLKNLVRAFLTHRRNIIRGNIHAIKKKGAKGMVRGAVRRSSELFRRLMAGGGGLGKGPGQ